jgi:hypothetical protein
MAAARWRFNRSFIFDRYFDQSSGGATLSPAHPGRVGSIA